MLYSNAIKNPIEEKARVILLYIVGLSSWR